MENIIMNNKETMNNKELQVKIVETMNNKEIMNNKKLQVKIVETKNHIKIIRDNTEPCFNIPKDTLGETIIIKNTVHSKWINELVNKSWCPLKTLYQLAKIIHRNHPNGGLDWCIQFYEIELSNSRYKKFRKEFSIKKKNLSYYEFNNSPFISYNNMILEDEYTDEIVRSTGMKLDSHEMFS